MPDTRSHRGPHPDDAHLFARTEMARLRKAVSDLSWLRTRGYGDRAALELVGNRYRLARRQRNAVARSACSNQSLVLRRAAACTQQDCVGEALCIDGFNTLVTLEGVLGGAYVFVGRDGCYRDVKAMAGTYRLVEETRPAIRLIGSGLDAVGAGPVQWVLDDHVSNVGRLRTVLREEARSHAWDWHVEITDQTDATLMHAPHVTVTSDSGILDRTERWFNLMEAVLPSAPGAPNIRRIG